MQADVEEKWMKTQLSNEYSSSATHKIQHNLKCHIMNHKEVLLHRLCFPVEHIT